MKSVNEFVKQCDAARCSMNIKQEFHMSRTTEASIRIIKDLEGRPLFTVKPNEDMPATILGFALILDSSIPVNCIDFVVSVRDTITRKRFTCL